MSPHVPAPAMGDGPLHQDRPRGLLDAPARQAVAGFAAAHPGWDGVICLPGDPTHWVHLSAGEIVSFQSFLSLRLARMLGAGDGAVDLPALSDSLSRPERLASQLRSAELAGARGATLGHLIGAELAAARPYWLGQRVVVIGAEGLAGAYAAALAAQGVPVEQMVP